MSPLPMTILICVLLEVALATLCWLAVHSVVGAVLLSAFFFGPASLFIGPFIYAKLKSRRTAL